MNRTSRREFLASTAAVPAAVAWTSSQAESGSRQHDQLFASVREADPRLRSIPNESFPLPFSEQEYADRLKSCREAMSKAGIDLLWITRPEGICYLSGYACTWYVASSTRKWTPHTGAAVHVDHDNFILFGGESAVPASVQDRRRLRSATRDPKTGRGQELGEARSLAEQLVQEGWLRNGTVVGLEYWSYLPPRAISEVYERAFLDKGARVVDGSDVMRGIRRVKSPAELETQEYASRFLGIGFRAVAQEFRPGMSHLEVVGIGMKAMMAAGSEWPGIPEAVLMGEPRSTHLNISQRQIQAGEVFSINFNGVYKRYHCDAARNFIWGDPSPALLKLSEQSKEAFTVVSNVAKAGTPIAKVTRALRDYYAQAGVHATGGSPPEPDMPYTIWCGGYEQGIAFPPDWVGEFEFGVRDEEPEGVFEANVVTNYESMLRQDLSDESFPLISYNIDTCIYEETGARFLCPVPPELIVCG